MRLMRIGDPGHERPVAATPDGQCYDLSPLTGDIDPAFLAADGATRAAAAIADGALPSIDPSGIRVGAPLAGPGALLCIGQNYAAHAAESGSAAPAEPILFYKAPNTVVGPTDDIRIPRGSERTDWEVELAVVIGRTARYLDEEDDPLSYVAGYALSNDVSERSFQLERSGGQWSKGKSCETFNPLGPWLVTPDEIPDPQKLRLRSWVGDAPRQDSTSEDMIFPVAELVRHLSQFLVLEPGDIINTGTPQGVALSGRFPYLAAGDTVSVEIEGLGRQRNTCVPWDAPRRPQDA
ncbi:fumarylacetoacetate hydrolase family protein [Streptomyces sp. NPDC090106]|uniref:fumarylacetoacetate hydrolase family protein n=1 Tax=Streptomyces sp. NPDC090106 TaxID=3365946 RepID=UPI0037F62793